MEAAVLGGRGEVTDWVRLWHDMPTDPKWRSIARRAGQRVGDVIATFNFVLVNASGNASERGRTHNLHAEDIAAALDIEEADVEAILSAMKGKVIDNDGKLLGWDKRQPKREDSTAAQRKAAWKERNGTQRNGQERPETDTESITLAKANAADAAFWAGAKVFLKPHVKGDPGQLIGKWLREQGKDITAAALNAAQLERAVNPLEFVPGYFRKYGKAKTHDRDRITV